MRSLSQEFYLLLAVFFTFCKDRKRKRTETKLDLPWWLFIHKTYELLLFFLSLSLLFFLLCNEKIKNIFEILLFNKYLFCN